MGDYPHITVEMEDPETISVSCENEEETEYLGPLIDALNDGLLPEPGTYNVEVTEKDGRYTFEVLSK